MLYRNFPLCLIRCTRMFYDLCKPFSTLSTFRPSEVDPRKCLALDVLDAFRSFGCHSELRTSQMSSEALEVFRSFGCPPETSDVTDVFRSFGRLSELRTSSETSDVPDVFRSFGRLPELWMSSGISDVLDVFRSFGCLPELRTSQMSSGDSQLGG